MPLGTGRPLPTFGQVVICLLERDYTYTWNDICPVWQILYRARRRGQKLVKRLIALENKSKFMSSCLVKSKLYNEKSSRTDLWDNFY